MQFFHWKFAVNSVIKDYSEMWELWTHLDWSFEFFNNFQTRQIQARNQLFSGEKHLLLCGSRFMKKNIFYGKKIERNLKLWRAWSLARLVHNVFSYLHFCKVGEIMLLKYGHLMLPVGYILVLYCVQYCVWYRTLAPFAKIIQDYFILMLNTKKRDWIGGMKYLVPFFKKKCFFFQIKCPFL